MAKFKMKPSLSQDVVGYDVYYRNHRDDIPFTKDDPNLGIYSTNLDQWSAPDENGFIYLEFDSNHPIFGSFDGFFDFGIASVDDADPPNVSPLLTAGLMNIGIDFVAPDPPSEASIVFG